MAPHLTESLRVLREHLGKRHVSVATARDLIQRTAHELEVEVDVRESARLAALLERATGCSIAELAIHAEQWPDV
jgi:hypothetical protein